MSTDALLRFVRLDIQARLACRALAISAAVVLLGGCDPPPAYDLIWLPPLPGDTAAYAYALNDAASPRVVGVSVTNTTTVRPVMWIIEGGIATPFLLMPIYPTSVSGSANAVDITGRSVGWSWAGQREFGVSWTSNIASDLTVLADHIIGEAIRPRAMDDNGLVVGDFSLQAGEATRAFVFRQVGTGPAQIWGFDLAEMMSGAPGGTSGLTAVTRTAPPAPDGPGMRYAAGWYGSPAMPTRHALLTNLNTVFLDLGTLGGGESVATGVSPVGMGADRRLVVVGWSTTSLVGTGATRHAFRWTRGGTGGIPSNPQMEDLGTLAGDAGSAARGVNESGMVVGASGSRAFLWERSSGMVDLNTLVPVADEPKLTVANAVNTRGDIVGDGLKRILPPGRQRHGFLLRPHPRVEMTKSAPPEVAGGGTLTYTFVLTNLAPTARTVVLRDPLPTGTSFDAAANPLWQLTGNEVTRSVTVAPMTTELVPLALKVTVFTGTIVNAGYRAEGDGVLATMWPSVTTLVVNQAPTVEVVTPATCPLLVPGGELAVDATASDADGSIARVDFYADGTLIGSDASAPYQVSWQNVPAGAHCLHAVAIDNGGATTTSTSTCVTTESGAYDVQELPPPPGTDKTNGHAINDAGVVVGDAAAADFVPRAVRWIGAVPEILSTRASTAYAINEAGTIAGAFLYPSSAFWWRAGLTFELGPHQGLPTTAVGINESGKVVVNYRGDVDSGCLVWDGLEVTDIGFIDPGAANPYSWCTAINDAGQVVGASGHFEGAPGGRQHRRIMLWTPGGTDGVSTNVAMRDLGHFGYLYGGNWALAVNNRTEVTGSARTTTGESHAFRWARGSSAGPPSNPEMQDLQTGEGTAINDRGVIVGGTRQTAGNARALLWACDGIVDLNDRIPPGSGWVLEVALGVNNLGHITGFGRLDGKARGFVLTPRP